MLFAACRMRNARQLFQIRAHLRTRLPAAAIRFVVVLVALPSLLYPFGADQAMFAYIGDQWLHGKLPYRDAWDIKPPGVFGVYAASEFIFGRSMMAARIMDLVCLLATCGILFSTLRKQFSRRSAALAAVLMGITYYTSFNYWDSAQAESYAAPVAALMFAALIRGGEEHGRRWLYAAGLCVGLMFVLKATFALYLLLFPLALIPLARQQSGRAALPTLTVISVGAFLTPVLLVWGYFWTHGSARYLEELYRAQLAYSKQPFDLSYMVDCIRGFFGCHGMVFILAVASLPALRPSLVKDYLLVSVAWCWLVLAFVKMVFQLRFSHSPFLPMIPPLAILSGITIGEAWTRVNIKGPAALKAICAALAAYLLLAPIAKDAARFGLACNVATGRLSQDHYWSCFTVVGAYPFSNAAHIAEYVRTNSKPDDKILVLDFEPAIYFLADRASPSRHVSIAPIVGQTQIPKAMRDGWKAEQERDAAANPPEFIVVLGCPHCYGMAEKHGVARRIHFGKNYYGYVKTVTKDQIYRREPRQVASSF